MGPSLPLHPSVVHFPVAATFFAAGALLLALLRPGARAACLSSAALLLAVSVAGGLAAVATGWIWADGLAYLVGGAGPIPGPSAAGGLARRHALLALAFLAAATLALALVLRARLQGRPFRAALLATLLACALVGATGHVGGTMVHAPPAPGEGAVPSR